MQRFQRLAGRAVRKTLYHWNSLFGFDADGARAQARRLQRLRLDKTVFDADFYLANNKDAREDGADAFEHYLTVGAAEGRVGRFFDKTYYLDRNRDVFRAGLEPLAHYRSTGRNEGRPYRFIEVGFRGRREVDYPQWYLAFAALLKSHLADRAAGIVEAGPLISVVMPVYNPEIRFLDEAIHSVLAQSYGKFELCIVDDKSPDPAVRERIVHWAARDSRIKPIFREENGHISAATNTGIEAATGQYIAFMDHDDELPDDALLCVAAMLASHPDCDLLYSDEDKIDERGVVSTPHFKPDFNPELLLVQNYINHLTVVRTERVREVGGLREGLEGAQDHDFLLRLSRVIPRSAIRHVPAVLYHWRITRSSTAGGLAVKPYVEAAALRAITDHCRSVGMAAEVSPIRDLGYYRVRRLVTGDPKVSIIIPTRDGLDVLRVCIDSLLAKTDYRNFEIIIADNDSRDARTLRYFETLKAQGVRILPCPGDFNFSRINNQAAAIAQGEILLLLNNDTEIVDGGWLGEMVSHVQQPDVGCVGARLLYPDRTLQHGGVILGIGGVAGHAHKYLPQTGPGYFCRALLPQQMSAVTAACLMVRKSVYDQVGGLDETLAVAFNDIDFCLKVDKAGYRNVWTPYAELIHHESKTRGEENSPAKLKRFRRETALMRERWGDRLVRDPYYNPNLTLIHEDFSLSTEPSAERWLKPCL